VRNYTGQTISRATTTDRLRPNGRVVTLPQRPVVSVASVIDLAAVAVDAAWDGFARLSLTYHSGLTAVDVTYTHGWLEVPDEIVGVVCAIAGRTLSVSSDQNVGMSSETIGAYSYSVGSAAASGGGSGILTNELNVLDAYRVPLPAIQGTVPCELKSGGIIRFDMD
jgi:hypothetical protein